MCANPTTPASFVRRTLAALVVLLSGVAAVNVSGSSADPQPALPGLPATPATPAPASPSGALFGAYVQAPGDDHDVQMAAVEQRERDLGRRLAIDHHFYPWDKEFPTARERADLRDGRIPLISWNGKTLNLAIGLGQYDELIRTRAQAVKALGAKVMIRWMWEMDGRQKAEHTTHPALYIAAWRHIATLRLAGQPVLTPPEGAWPAVPGADEAAWDDARALVELRYRELVTAVRGFDDQQLDSPLAEGFSSAYVTLHGIIHHDLYHAGQISLLKKS